jgi:hypothetical protein
MLGQCINPFSCQHLTFEALAYGSVGFYVLHDYMIAYNFNDIFLSARTEGEEIYVNPFMQQLVMQSTDNMCYID